jgi:concentrative nucleoside transporter, CNT family
MGYICYPIAFLLGVPRPDILHVAQLIGIKIIANEFVAFSALTKEAVYIAMSPRSQIIATYALCGKCVFVSYNAPQACHCWSTIS